MEGRRWKWKGSDGRSDGMQPGPVKAAGGMRYEVLDQGGACFAEGRGRGLVVRSDARRAG